MTPAITIDPRFNGPAGSANGGYAAGRLAAHVDAEAVEVTLRRPPPLGRPLDVAVSPDGARLLDGPELVAEATAAELAADAPAPVSVAEAEAAVPGYLGFRGTPYPTCFVCGPGREAGDGLDIFAGPLADGRRAASPWTPAAEFAGPDGAVLPEFVWAALDCPSAMVVANEGSLPAIVLGRFTARLIAPVRAGAPHVAIAWPLAQEGRKREAGSAILTADGELAAIARALWIELKAPAA